MFRLADAIDREVFKTAAWRKRPDVRQVVRASMNSDWQHGAQVSDLITAVPWYVEQAVQAP